MSHALPKSSPLWVCVTCGLTHLYVWQWVTHSTYECVCVSGECVWVGHELHTWMSHELYIWMRHALHIWMSVSPVSVWEWVSHSTYECVTNPTYEWVTNCHASEPSHRWVCVSGSWTPHMSETSTLYTNESRTVKLYIWMSDKSYIWMSHEGYATGYKTEMVTLHIHWVIYVTHMYVEFVTLKQSWWLYIYIGSYMWLICMKSSWLWNRVGDSTYTLGHICDSYVCSVRDSETELVTLHIHGVIYVTHMYEEFVPPKQSWWLYIYIYIGWVTYVTHMYVDMYMQSRMEEWRTAARPSPPAGECVWVGHESRTLYINNTVWKIIIRKGMAIWKARLDMHWMCIHM